ncbi:pyridoxal-phosphate-dependent aminotransferase family protein [Sulfobacillus harzensis]|uniref:Alanine--glyoxylate aminotransferase family protein n=1 Tax=Sulfobacillus harzensis TaxID=2729629 RepID=A0A7Y0L1W0_9FIRM|nr:alanine--glyoxylate aminotransferase family protein [Sulfobacillus harzensis]NMP21487.1 alanine--glyoxylate aminotransferase family protein [Sulfobacillus harzensis]
MAGVLPERLLLAPGPSPVSEAVRQAMARPVLGHLDPAFLALVDGVQDKLRQVFGTTNRLTFPVSGTGSAGMQMSLVNFLEPGDTVIVVEQGIFGQRLADAARRLGAEVVSLSVPFGEIVSREQLQIALQQHPETRLVAVVKAETSTGVLQPLEGWADLVHHHGALLLVDAVTALGGIPVEVDRMGFDIVFSGTQKCLGAPPGLAPITVNDQALERLQERTMPVPSWYFDLSAIAQYLGRARAYHHTAPISMIYALDAALDLILDEGLDAVFNRHRRVAEALWAGLEAMGLQLMVPVSHRLPTVATVRVPAGVNEAQVRRRLLEDHGIEIAGGLGPWAGKIWRVGVMGQGAQIAHMMTLLTALRSVLTSEGHDVPSGLGALEETYHQKVGQA